MQKGGHNVPEADIVRRFGRSLFNFWRFYRRESDQWQLMFNSGDAPLDVAVGEEEEMDILDETLFERFMNLVRSAGNE